MESTRLGKGCTPPPLPYQDCTASDPSEVNERVERGIQRKNSELASYETIKKFAILAEDFEVGEELTPTLKVKRKFTIEKYWDILDGFYQQKQVEEKP